MFNEPDEGGTDASLQRPLSIVLEYVLDLIAFTKKFYDKHADIIQQIKMTGMLSKPINDAKSLLFLHELLSSYQPSDKTKREIIKRNLVDLLVQGVLRIEKLEELAYRLSDRNGGENSRRRGSSTQADLSRLKPERIAVFGWKVVGLSNEEIAKRLGLNRKTVLNHGTPIYETFAPDSLHLDSEERLAFLVKAAVEEGFIFSQKESSKHSDARPGAV